MDRPNVEGNTVCSKADEVFLPFFGGEYYEACTYTKDQVKHLEKIYGPLDREQMKLRNSPDFIGPLTKEKDGNAYELMLAGGMRNILRAAKRDGQRLIGVLAKYVEPDEDPVKVLIRILIDAGYDVDPENVDWVEEE